MSMFDSYNHEQADTQGLFQRAHLAEAQEQILNAEGADMEVELLPFCPYEDVLGHIMAHPLGLPVLHGYDPSPNWDHLLDCGCEPANPHERLRWRHTREAFDSIKPYLKEREEILKRYKKQRNYHILLSQLEKCDPLFNRTMLIMEHYTGKLPLAIQKLSMPVLAREFGSFLELYRYLREAAHLVENHEHHRHRKAAQGKKNHGKASGREADERKEKRRELIERVKAGGAREGDLLRYLELSGV